MFGASELCYGSSLQVVLKIGATLSWGLQATSSSARLKAGVAPVSRTPISSAWDLSWRNAGASILCSGRRCTKWSASWSSSATRYDRVSQAAHYLMYISIWAYCLLSSVSSASSGSTPPLASISRTVRSMLSECSRIRWRRRADAFRHLLEVALPPQIRCVPALML
jgi:hypothetical protein